MLNPRYANYGCGPEQYVDNDRLRWVNFDSRFGLPDFDADCRIWDITTSPDEQYVEWFDGGVISHVLCTMNDYQAHQALINIHRTLKPGAILTVVDMDLLKVFKSYQEGRIEDIPIEEGDIDDRLCYAISGHGTRRSLYTPERMRTVLTQAGFRLIMEKETSEYDTRPKESLVFEAVK